MVGGHLERATGAAAGGRLSRIERLFEFFATFLIAPFDQSTADLLDSLQVAKVRIATRDLKIAAISLASNALLLTANRRDFEKVPGLSFSARILTNSSPSL